MLLSGSIEIGDRFFLEEADVELRTALSGVGRGAGRVFFGGKAGIGADRVRKRASSCMSLP